MTMEDAFGTIFQSAFDKVCISIDFTDDLNELNAISVEDYKNIFILELIRFFEKNYNQDLLTMYSEYFKKCSSHWIDKFLQHCENEGL